MATSQKAPKSGTPITMTKDNVPFAKSVQLCDKLVTKLDNKTGIESLAATAINETCLPGYPRVSLDRQDIEDCIEKELTTPLLDKMFPYLWMVASQSSSHVSTLTEQVVRGREVVITENPEMHLVWVNNRVFLKPIPAFLLSFDLWRLHLGESAPMTPLLPTAASSAMHGDEWRRAALGYVRTYYYLVRYESDFRMARQHHLIPENIDFPRFMAFTSSFGNVPDDKVTPRYRYGQLRLTRLNLWAKVALRRWNFHKVQWQYADIFANFYGPVLLVFGFLSIILAAMQVGTQARPGWDDFASVSAWFSVLSLVLVVVIGVLMCLLLLFLLLSELTYAVGVKIRKRKRRSGKSP